MNQPEPTTKPTRSIGLWLIMLALVVVGVPLLLLLAMISVYFSSRSAHVEMRDRTQVAERLAAELQARQAATPPQLSTPAVFPQAAAEQIDASIAQIRVEFPDFGSRTADALIIDETNGLTLLTAPSSIFAPITGKLNGRMMTRQPALIVLNDVSIQMPASGGSSMPPVAGLPSMMGGIPMQSREVAIAAQLPGLGLTLLRTQTHATPLRIKGDFAKAEVGEALSVRQKSIASLPPTTLTVLDTDAAVTDTTGQQLEHLLKLTAWHDGLGGIVFNSKGEPIGQVVLTVPEQSGSSFTYAAPLGRIFDDYYAQTSDSTEGASPGAGASGDKLRTGIATGGMAEALPLRPGAENVDPFVQPLRARSADPELTSPIQADSPPAFRPDNAPADALLPSPVATESELRIYKVKSFAATVADKLRPLFSDELQIAADTANGTVLVLADKPTHEKVATALKSIDEVALRQSKEQDLSNARSPRDEIAIQSVSIPSAAPGPSGDSLQGVTTDVKPGKNRPGLQTSPQGVTGRIALDPGPPPIPPPTRIDDHSMDHQARQLAQKYLSANPAEQAVLRKELVDLTERHFNLRQAERQREIDEIGKRLEKLRSAHQQRQQRKSEIMERRLQDLLDINSDFWTGESRNSKKPPARAQAAMGGAGDLLRPSTASLPNPNSASENPPAVQDSTTIPETAAIAAKTFDGVPYAQWLNLLQTERKPDLIAAAIDASSRLAEPQDQARIVHQIFIAAQFTKFSNESERLLVWETSWKGLESLRPELVAAELLAVVHNPDATQSGLQFVGQCLANHLTKPLQEELFKQAPKLVDELLALHQRGGAEVDWLLAGASALWRETSRPISDFSELQAQMLKFIEDGFAMEVSGPVETIRPEWLIVAGALIARNPDAPNLAVTLYHHAKQSREVLALIGELGRHAEPAVPLLVDDFVANWNVYERESRLAEPNGSFIRAATPPPAPPQRCRDLIAVLGKIGVGEKGGFLLRDLRLILPPSRTQFRSPGEMRLAPLAASVAAAVPQWTLPSNDALPLILNDQTMITGTWRLSDGLPSPSNVLLRLDQSTAQVPRSDGGVLFLAEGGQKLGDRFEINPTAAVKQISFFEVTGPRGSDQKELAGTRRDGIYELTGTKLRFQLGGLAQPRPVAFAKDRAELAEGELLLEFQREIPDWTESRPAAR